MENDAQTSRTRIHESEALVWILDSSIVIECFELKPSAEEGGAGDLDLCSLRGQSVRVVRMGPMGWLLACSFMIVSSTVHCFLQAPRMLLTPDIIAVVSIPPSPPTTCYSDI